MDGIKDNLYKRMSKIRNLLCSKSIKKTGKASYDFKVNSIAYEYFELQDFLPDLLRLMDEHGVCSICNLDTEKSIATLTIINSDNPTERETIQMPIVIPTITPTQDGKQKKTIQIMQEFGAVYTYARRHLYLAALEIVETNIIDKFGAINRDNPPQKSDKIQTQYPIYKKTS